MEAPNFERDLKTSNRACSRRPCGEEKTELRTAILHCTSLFELCQCAT